MSTQEADVKPAGILRTAGTAPQLEFWQSQAKYRAFIGGVGSGKTTAGAIEILRQPANSAGMVVAPTYDMLQLSSLPKFFECAEPFIGHGRGWNWLATLHCRQR